jgi:hypothetical protein
MTVSSPERIAIRENFRHLGYTRTHYTNADDRGVYSETYSKPDGSSLVITWDGWPEPNVKEA